MKIIWSPTARADRLHIFQHIVEDSFNAAVALEEAFDDLVGGLAQFPHKGKGGRLAGTREMVAHPNYVIVYRVSDGEVEIARIIHAARRWP